jgi:hypothetical protein
VEAKQITLAPAPLACWISFFLDVQMIGIGRGQGDQVDAEGVGHQPAGGQNLFAQRLHRHVAAGQQAEAAGVAHGADQVGIADPGHGAAHNGITVAQKLSAFFEKTIDEHIYKPLPKGQRG